jgi:acetyl-CoA/propionyl-CoA carboxylase biotin carboxyl carrier protein
VANDHVVTSGWTVARREDGRLQVSNGTHQLVADAIIGGGSVWVWLDGHLFEFPTATRSARAKTGAGEDALTPQMSAKVIRVLVEPGQRVAAGDTLVVLEAMKMEMPIRAPHAGTVAVVNCAEGELVTPDNPVVVLSH